LENNHQEYLNDVAEGMRSSVTVIGLGPMGRAMANVFLNHGLKVTVWNRTTSKADDLVSKGAIRASSVNEALVANVLVILSLTDYNAMYSILEPASENLAGRTFVNLSSDTPDKAREAASWLADHGAKQITGGVKASPSQIGQLGFSTYYSGPREIFEVYQDTLKVLTGTDYRGEDPGLAALYYQIEINIFWTSMLSYLHAMAIANANGITAKEFLPYVSETISSLPQFFEFYTPRLDAREYIGDVERLSMGVASVEHVVHTANEAGIDTSLPTAVLEIFKRGIANGHADDSFTSLIEIFKNAKM
jgi:3-hydroxyisobutyrate dehydrogenase-like beta-hydroxyacid dehydrogenase